MHFVNIGFGNLVQVRRIVAMITPDSAPAKRYIQKAKENGTLTDATQGRRTRGVLMMDDGRIIISSLLPDTIAGRIENAKGGVLDE
ncbi:MAG: DUF370 domain-containing protein [Lachnospiraceae bacterium]|nr:DUF370 domain-containing protein [Lachnospiraceae bacterium]